MKTAFKIYRNDIAKIAASWVTLVIMFGLIILPPLYAWINIYGSWDPYGNTKGIQVVVVNEDKGAKLQKLNFNIGQEMVSSLKTNNKIGWIFNDNEDEGIQMAQRGDVYATIIIPEDFSYRMTTLISPNPIKPNIAYYVNEKENAIAPKMTDAVANNLQREISASIIENATQKASEKFNQLGIDFQNKSPDIEKYINMLYVVDKNFPNLDGKLKNLSKSAKDGTVVIDQTSNDFIYVRDTLNKAIDLNENLSDSLLNIDARIKEYSPDVRENILLAQSIFKNISNDMGTLGNDVVKDKPEMIKDIDDSLKDLGTFEKDVTDLRDNLLELNNKIPDAVSLSNDIISDIGTYKEILRSIKNSLDDWEKARVLLKDLSTLSSNISDQLSNLENKINQYYKTIDRVLAPLESELNKIEDLLDNIDNSQSVSSNVSQVLNLIKQNNEKLAQHPEISSGILALNKDIYQNLQDISSNISELKANRTSLSTLIHLQRAEIESQRTEIITNIDLAQNILSQLSEVCNDLGDISSDDLYFDINKIINNLTTVQNTLKDNSKKLADSQAGNEEKITTRSDEILKKTEELKSMLTKLRGKLNDRNSFETVLFDTQKLTYNIQSSLDRIVVSMDDNILPRIENYLENGSILIGDIDNIMSNSKNNIQYAQNFLKDVSDDGKVSVKDIDSLRSKLPEMQKALDSVTSIVKKIQNSFGLNQLIDFLKSDGETEGDNLASPVQLSTHKLYEMQNYGTGLTPFYTALSIWVGSLFLIAILTTKSKNTTVPFTPIEEFFGKYFLFATIALIQALVVSLGDLFILRISVHNPILFVLLAMLDGLLFSMIVYSLTATMGNIGKAIAIILLLLQLTGAGGTFPIQVTPPFFQTIHKVLPFTYAISGFREAIYGVIFDTLVKDVLAILLFYVFFTVLGIILKKVLTKHTRGYSKQLSKSGVT